MVVVCIKCLTQHFFHIYFTKPKQKYNGVLNNTNPRLIYRSYSTGRLTNAQRESFLVSPDLHEILIGISLGITLRKTLRKKRLT